MKVQAGECIKKLLETRDELKGTGCIAEHQLAELMLLLHESADILKMALGG